MADQVYDDARRRRMRRNTRQKTVRNAPPTTEEMRRTQSRRGFLATLDKPMLAIVGLLLIIGGMMIFSTTFDWSNASRGSATAIFVEDHLRNVILATLGLTFFYGY
jgi:cell division protein FtsW (lipid II flippase)